MEQNLYWYWIMDLRGGYEPGDWGTLSDMSDLGYASLASEVEEKLVNPFNDYTFGSFSGSLTLIEILEDGSWICILDDDKTKAIIFKDQQDCFEREMFYEEFLKRLESQLNTHFETYKEPDFDWNLFEKMIKIEPFKFPFFSLGGYFEHPYTIAESMAALEKALLDD